MKSLRVTALTKFITLLTALPPPSRRFLLITIDAILLPLAVWLSFWLRLATPFHANFISVGWWLLQATLLIGLPLYYFTGQYKGLTRYVGSASVYRLANRNGLLVLILIGVGVMLRLPMPPRSSWLLLWFLLTGFTGSIRFALRDLLLSMSTTGQRKNIHTAIYGAGEAGAQLASALRHGGNHQIITFIDDAPELWSRTINGIPIQPPQVLSKMDYQIDRVLLAIPSLHRSDRRRIVAELHKQASPVLQIPSIDDLASGQARIDDLQPVAIEDLLGRDSVPPDPRLLGPGICDAVVCVTGAGGSIGSELCRQILSLNPKRLILLENSEAALYAIDQELRGLLPKSVQLLPVLGSATNASLVEKLFGDQGLQVLFHAAAYKHVPLVEANPLVGLANNFGSTRVVCRAAAAAGVKEVVLISTDKAVRPTNVMGASKRLSELVMQASALEAMQSNHGASRPRTSFAMVRFGNVLDSSGSVVPLFRRQIAAGGPITVTHPEIIRYFMTIPEAAQLVLQSAVLAQGGDLFLLDMGNPVSIKGLAEEMVRLSGLSVRDARNPEGDIEILCKGLRPGEKLYEELLIEAELEATCHPLIFRAHEHSIPPSELWPRLDSLQASIDQQDKQTAFAQLAELVPEWNY